MDVAIYRRNLRDVSASEIISTKDLVREIMGAKHFAHYQFDVHVNWEEAVAAALKQYFYYSDGDGTVDFRLMTYIWAWESLYDNIMQFFDSPFKSSLIGKISSLVCLPEVQCIAADYFPHVEPEKVLQEFEELNRIVLTETNRKIAVELIKGMSLCRSVERLTYA